MGNIDELLAADEKNVQGTRACLDAFSSKLPEAMDTAVGMYHTFARVIGQQAPIDQDLREVAECAEALEAKDAAALNAIRAAQPSGPAVAALLAQLNQIELRIESRIVRGIVFTQIARAYLWGFSDILRMRITAAIGYQRLQAEGFGLLCVMRDDPAVALEWRGIVNDEEGKRFFKKHQSKVMQEIEKADLTYAYEQGSGVALHLRFAGAVHGLSFDSGPVGARIAMTTELSCQELRPEAPQNFIIQVLGVLETQVRILAALTTAWPGPADPIWTEQWVPRLRATMRELWGHVPTAFPHEFAEWEKAHGPLPRPQT